MAEDREVCRLTELPGIPVMTQETGRKLGNVKDVIFDPAAGRLDALSIERPGFFGPHRRFLLLDDIESVGEDAIMVRTGRVLKNSESARREDRIVRDGISLMGKTVVTEGGNILGGVSDVIFDPETGTARKYEVSGGTFADVQAGRRTFPVPRALVVGPDALVVPNSVEQQLESQAPGGITGAYQTTAAGAAGFWDRTKQWWRRTVRRAGRATAEQEAQFALGKTSGNMVTDDQGNVIVDEGEKITDRVVARAGESGKLHQLALAAGWGSTRRGYETAKERVGRMTAEQEARYVLGKEAGRTVRDDEGHVIVWSGDEITQDDVDRAREADKLGALTASVAGAQAGAAGERLKERGREVVSGTKEAVTGTTEEVSRRRLTAQQRDMAQGKVSATDIRDNEGNLLIAEGELFTPMILDRLEDEGRLEQIRLMPVMGTERAPAETQVPRVEIIIRGEEHESATGTSGESPGR